MRISTNLMFQKHLTSITNTNVKWQESGSHLSTGKKILAPSDDPIGSSQSLILKQAQSRNDQFQSARENANDSLSCQETVLQEANTVIHSIQETLVYAGDETLTDLDRLNLADKLKGLKEELFSLANAKDANGNYLFAGYKNDTPPFVISAGQVSYVGGSANINVFIDETHEVSLSFTGSQIFMTGANPNAESNIFASIDYALEALETGIDSSNPAAIAQFRDGLSKASQGIANSFENISTVRAAGGNVLTELERLTMHGKALDNEFETQISLIEDVDWYEEISKYMMLQVNLQAAQYTFKSLQSMSLFQQA